MDISRPWRITLDTNPDDCNMHCVMCEEHSVHSKAQTERKRSGIPDRRMPLELVRNVIEQAKELGVTEVIPSTMGEPLLYHHFEEMLSLIQSHGMRMNLTTNGTFPRLGAKAWAQKIVPLTSDIKISWNAATPETDQKIMIGSNWNRRIQGVKDLISIRDEHFQRTGYYCGITFQMTFLEMNIHELDQMIELCLLLGIDRLKGHHLWTHFPEIEHLSMRRSSKSIHRWNHAVSQAKESVEKNRFTNGKKLLLENFFPLDPQQQEDIAPGDDCPFIGKEIWISAEGKFNPCCAPNQERLTLGEFGNLKEVSLSDIWYGRPYRNLIQNYQNHALCKGCNMRTPK